MKFKTPEKFIGLVGSEYFYVIDMGSLILNKSYDEEEETE